jgi:hypothetical protein
MWLTLVVIAVLLIAGLEWNRRRQVYPGQQRAGRTGVQDRDLERVLAELHAAEDRES